MSKQISCPDNCSFALQTFKFSECAPKVKEGGICNIFLRNVGNPLVNWESLTEWTDNIDNTSTDADAIRALTVTGDVPLPESTEKTISHQRIIKLSKKRTANAKIDDDSDDNYDAMRQLQCGGSYLAWILTNGGDLYGGNSGIQVTIDTDEVIPESIEENTYINLVLKWQERISPLRIAAPMPVPFTSEDA